MAGMLKMEHYDLNNYLRQMDSFRAADQARENLVNVSNNAGTKTVRKSSTDQSRNLLRSYQVSHERMKN